MGQAWQGGELMAVNQYRVTVRHNGGRVVILTAATSEDAARAIVEAAEGCPASTIKRVSVVRPRRDYWRGSNAGDRRESRMLARLAR